MDKSLEKYPSKYSTESKSRKTVGLTMKPELSAKAREMNLNFLKTLKNIITQLIETQNKSPSHSESSLSAKEKKFNGASGGI